VIRCESCAGRLVRVCRGRSSVGLRQTGTSSTTFNTGASRRDQRFHVTPNATIVVIDGEPGGRITFGNTAAVLRSPCGEVHVCLESPPRPLVTTGPPEGRVSAVADAPDTARSGVRAPWLVISPHFDDAVLSCGHWLARNPGVEVVTVCSGIPGPGVAASDGWDALAGFTTADHAARARRAEDSAALATLGARQRFLDFLDRPYRDERSRLCFEAELTRSIEELLDEIRPARCLLPLGLLHPDHVSTGRAARVALRNHPLCTAIAYADLPYAITDRSLVGDRIAQIQSDEAMLLTELPGDRSADDIKYRALACYETQLRLLDWTHPTWRDALNHGSEQFWRLLPAPAPIDAQVSTVARHATSAASC
jgi:LmbE family N-acetylglucosaminyl deacetylase